MIKNNKRINLADRTIMLTGAAGGLGQSLVKALIREEKARVIAVDINRSELQRMKEIYDKSDPGALEIYDADLSGEKNVEELYRTVTGEYRIYGLINNAALTHFGKTESGNMERYEKIISINYIATLKLSLLFMDQFRRNNGGFLYNISSLTGLLPVAYQNVYSSTKHAIQSFTYGLHEENGNDNIFIGLFAPGGINTAMFESSGLKSHFDGKKVGIMPPEFVAGKILSSLKKKKLFSVASLFDLICVYAIKIFPGKITRRVLGQIYKPVQQEQ